MSVLTGAETYHSIGQTGTVSGTRLTLYRQTSSFFFLRKREKKKKKFLNVTPSASVPSAFKDDFIIKL